MAWVSVMGLPQKLELCSHRLSQECNSSHTLTCACAWSQEGPLKIGRRMVSTSESPALDPVEEGAPSDAELLWQLVERVEFAMDRFYDRFAPLVYGLALRISGSAPDAAEIVQEVFLYIWQEAASWNPARGSVRAWICVLTRSRALDLVRRHRRQPISTHAEEPGIDAPDPAPAVDTLLLSGAEASRLHGALVALRQEERLVLTMAYFEDRSQTEIAQTLGMPLGTVKTHTLRGLSRIRSLLATQADQKGAA